MRISEIRVIDHRPEEDAAAARRKTVRLKTRDHSPSCRCGTCNPGRTRDAVPGAAGPSAGPKVETPIQRYSKDWHRIEDAGDSWIVHRLSDRLDTGRVWDGTGGSQLDPATVRQANTVGAPVTDASTMLARRRVADAESSQLAAMNRANRAFWERRS